MIGGFRKAAKLMPGSVEGQTGLGVAPGIAKLRLDAVR